jgi:2-dehydro-3-deoxyphosphogluconate aldolase/(4S)-4-hydroxy-2-oxoglutarate aldolase
VSRDETLHEIGRRRVSAIIRTRDESLARDAMKAAVAGGFRTIEFTLTTPSALRLIEEFSRDADLLVGAGTVLAVEQARDAVAAGARFLVSPVASPQIIAAAASLDAISIPGVFTPNEMVTAQMYGADLLKLFPSPGDVAAYLAAILGPLPSLRIFPTAGITPLNFAEVLAAGAFGVGFTRSLFEPEDMESRDFKAIERRAADLMERLPK